MAKKQDSFLRMVNNESSAADRLMDNQTGREPKKAVQRVNLALDEVTYRQAMKVVSILTIKERRKVTLTEVLNAFLNEYVSEHTAEIRTYDELNG